MQCKLLPASREHGFKLGTALQAFRHVAHRRPLYLVARTYPVRIVVVLADVIGLLLGRKPINVLGVLHST